MSRIFLTSDLHLYHENVMLYSGRPYRNLAHMHKEFVSNWNNIISKSDKVYVLGDVSFGNKKKTAAVIKRLRGYKILIMGNHDFQRSRKWWLDAGFDEVIRFPIIIENKYILSHEPVDSVNFFNYHGHIHKFSYSNPDRDKEYIPDDDRHHNVNVEFNDYKPVELKLDI